MSGRRSEFEGHRRFVVECLGRRDFHLSRNSRYIVFFSLCCLVVLCYFGTPVERRSLNSVFLSLCCSIVILFFLGNQ